MYFKYIFLSLLFYCSPLISQDNSQEIEKFKLSLKLKEEERIKKIEEYVKKTNCPRTGYTENGDFFYIHHIHDEGYPVYYTGKSENAQVNFYTKKDSVFNRVNAGSIQSFTVDNSKWLKVELGLDIKELRVIHAETLKIVAKKIKPGKEVILNIEKWTKADYIIIIQTSNNLQILSQFKR